ncbi:sulfotransferase [Aliifodinibius salicampi]|uniref:Sulfotransferase n=1 Tax=Fodinibius salicampi TaxID=1920655 RepID=A0ABT3PXQ8_9BACT|nr:sulfotransferase [Fodinibius salicampi]MCW9712618.1 sulfotransferase [Fodinibius salicampi]
MQNNPILVTGIHRSGSTFVGNMLSLNRNIGYIQEPFNRDYGLKIFDVNFTYLTDTSITHQIQKTLDQLILLDKADYHIPSINREHHGLENRKELCRDFFAQPNIQNTPAFIKRLLFKSKGQLLFNRAKYDPRVDRLLIKDPLACLASSFLHQRYDMDVVILVRHPLSFAGSLKRLGWRFNFDNILSQEQLMSDYLKPYREELIYLQNKQTTVVEEAAMLWNCIYTVLTNFISKNPSFIVCRHEDIAQSPVKTFHNLYSKLNLNYTASVEKKISEHTNEDNPVSTQNNRAHQLKRNSEALIYKWKDILTEDEIIHISEKTKKIASNFYQQDFFRDI